MSVNEKMTAIADAIRAKTGGTESLTLDQMAAEIAGIQAGGGGENALDYSISPGVYTNVNFGGGVELTVSFGSKTNVAVLANSFKNLFQNASGLKSIKIIYGGKNAGIVYGLYAFQMWETELELIDLTQLVNTISFNGDCSSLFNGRQGLKQILGELDLSSVWNLNLAFRSCLALEDVRFKAESIMKDITLSNSSLLNDASIQSVIDGLADMTGGTAQTLSLHSSVVDKLTAEQQAQIINKNWSVG